ncbi:MAG TPA: YggT family protein [Capillimicrobium sp.]|nr:YggT family protein [Capillimicrobium sp.]
MLAAVTRDDVADFVATLIWVYTILIFAYIVMSLVFAFARGVPYNRYLMGTFEFLREISDPLLAPFRRIIPSVGPFDFSPIVALFALRIVGAIVVSLIRG